MQVQLCLDTSPRYAPAGLLGLYSARTGQHVFTGGKANPSIERKGGYSAASLRTVCGETLTSPESSKR